MERVSEVNDGLITLTKSFGAVDAQPLDNVAYVESPAPTQARRTARISPRFSVASATGKFALALGTYLDGIWKPKAWVETPTLTASATIRDITAGNFPASGADLGLAGYTHFKVHCTALSSGTVEVEVSVF